MAVHRLLRKFERRNRGRSLAGTVENLIAAVQTRHTSKRRGCVSDNENHFQDSFFLNLVISFSWVTFLTQ